jgi:hypothetical protein
MANYLKKEEKREDVEVFYAYGEDDDFNFAGEQSFRISKQSDCFSWKNAEIDGEYRDGKMFSKRKGIHKKKYKFEEY